VGAFALEEAPERRLTVLAQYLLFFDWRAMTTPDLLHAGQVPLYRSASKWALLASIRTVARPAEDLRGLRCAL